MARRSQKDHAQGWSTEPAYYIFVHRHTGNQMLETLQG